VQVAPLNRINSARNPYWSNSYLVDQEQTFSSLSFQQRSLSAATEFTNPSDTANSNTNSSDPNQGHRNDIQPFQPQQFLGGLSVQRQYIPVETAVSGSMNDTINYDNRDRLPHAHHYDNHLYQPQQALSGPSRDVARTHSIWPLDTTEYNTNYSSQYHESESFNQVHQQQNLWLPEPTEIQPIRPIARRPSDIATSNTNYGHLHQEQAHGFMLQQPSLPRPIVPGPIVQAVTFHGTNRADSARHCSGTDSGLNVSSRLALPSVRPTQPSPLPPAPVPPARPEQQEKQVAPLQVSNSPRVDKHADVWGCGCILAPNVFSVRIG
jgi:hypothetical protein